MAKKAKNLASYLAALPEKKMKITLQKPNAAVRDYDEGDFPLDLVAVGVIIENQPYITAFEMTKDVKDKIMEVQAGAAVTVAMIADDADADTFPSIVLA